MKNNSTILQLGDCYLIKDTNLKTKKFIGKIISIGPNGVTLIKYIFPEDTKEGRKDYMSFYEILLTDQEILYEFSKNKEQETKVIVTNLPNYIKRINQKEEQSQSVNQIYFQRQKYFKNGDLEPTLQPICYCQKYFNPDYVFRTCSCGCIFHPMCFINSKTNKCWNENCNVDCTCFLSPEELLDKKNKMNQPKIKSAIITTPTPTPTPTPGNPKKKSVVMSEDFFIIENIEDDNSINDNFIDLNEVSKFDYKFDTAELFKKSKKRNQRNDTIEVTLTKTNIKEKEKEKKIKKEPFIDLEIKTEENIISPIKTPKKIFDTTVYERKPGGGYQPQIRTEYNSFEENKRKMDTERERAYKIIYDNLINGVKFLQNNMQILDDFQKEKKEKQILTEQISIIKENNKSTLENKYKKLAKSIENNLFKNCEESTGPAYFSFLQEFALLIKNSKKLLFKIILGELSPETISKFKVDDFLPEEKRREKEELKNKEIQKIKFNGPMQIMAISNKGRMLTEIQDNIDINKNNYAMDTQIHMITEEKQSFSEYSQKYKDMKDKYPYMDETDVKFLVEAKEPNEEDIQSRINSIIQETLNLEEQKEFLSFRRNKLKKKAERYYKKLNDGSDKKFLGKKIQDYIEFISLGI